MNANMNDPFINEEERTRHIYGFINNGAYNLNQEGNQGRYTRSHHFQTLDEWESIFRHFLASPVRVHDTADFLENRMMLGIMSGQVFEYDSFPEITWIPLPCSIPNFRRCILHVEEVNRATGHLMGSFIPIEVTYHDNHPITETFTRIFQVDANYPPMFQTNDDLVLMTTFDNASLQRMCECLTKGGQSFAEYDAMNDPNRTDNANLTTVSRQILYDPDTLQRANAVVERMMPPGCNGDISIEQYQRMHEAWRSVVFPETTLQQQRNAYARYAADQINMHRYFRLHWAHEYPQYPNPVVLPFHDRHHYHHQRENNPADHNQALEAPVNHYIQALYDGQNNNERARIAATDVRLRQNQIPIDGAPLQPPDLPVNRVLEYDG